MMREQAVSILVYLASLQLLLILQNRFQFILRLQYMQSPKVDAQFSGHVDTSMFCEQDVGTMIDEFFVILGCVEEEFERVVDPVDRPNDSGVVVYASQGSCLRLSCYWQSF